jgi:hypothetical protein
VRHILTALILAVITISAADANDAGPARDVRTLRHDVPILLARMHESIAVTDVVVLRGEAIAIWNMKWPGANAPTSRGLMALRRKNGRWWDVGELIPQGYVWVRSAPGGKLIPQDFSWVRSAPGFRGGCDSSSAGALEVEAKGLDRATLVKMPISSELVDLAAQHVPTIDHDSTATPLPPGPMGCTMYQVPPPSFLLNITDGYQTDLLLPFDAKRVTFSQRAPTAAEMPPTPGGNAYYFFTLTSADEEADLPFPDSSSFQVWCPFVLDPAIKYQLSLSGTTIELAPIPLDLGDNILRAKIPALIVTAGHALDGEIISN